jgi:hypothetical protein
LLQCQVAKTLRTTIPQRAVVVLRSSAFTNGTVSVIIDSSECAKTVKIRTVTYDENIERDRHFGQNTIGWIRRLETGSVEFVVAGQRLPDGTPAAHLFGGDSGGACLSKTNALVGIAASTARNQKGETLSVFTSVYAHRDWLLQQRRAL